MKLLTQEGRAGSMNSVTVTCVLPPAQRASERSAEAAMAAAAPQL